MLTYKQTRPSISTRISPKLKEDIDKGAKGLGFMSSTDLKFFDIGDDGVQYLSTVINQKIEHLDLYNNRLTMVGISYLSKPRLQCLRSLNIGENRIGNVGVKVLTRCQWGNLQELELSYCQLDGSGLIHLEKGRWPNMKYICLSSNRVGSGLGRLVRGN